MPIQLQDSPGRWSLHVFHGYKRWGLLQFAGETWVLKRQGKRFLEALHSLHFLDEGKTQRWEGCCPARVWQAVVRANVDTSSRVVLCVLWVSPCPD